MNAILNYMSKAIASSLYRIWTHFGRLLYDPDSSPWALRNMFKTQSALTYRKCDKCIPVGPSTYLHSELVMQYCPSFVRMGYCLSPQCPGKFNQPTPSPASIEPPAAAPLATAKDWEETSYVNPRKFFVTSHRWPLSVWSSNRGRSC